MLLMFTNSTDFHAIWSRQIVHGFPIASRSLLVRSSFVSRSSLVAQSLVYRRPIEDRTRNKRKTNERATNIDRDADEKLSATRRVATFMAGSMPFCNHKPAKCLLLPICRGRTLHFLSTLSISVANITISSILFYRTAIMKNKPYFLKWAQLYKKVTRQQIYGMPTGSVIV